MSEWYHEIIDCRNEGSRTGKGATFTSGKKARDSFAGFRLLEVPSDRAEFLLDLHDATGDLVDTIRLDSAGFKVVTGEAPATPAEYDRLDQGYWKQAKEQHNADS